jgi:hypothetical protein
MRYPVTSPKPGEEAWINLRFFDFRLRTWYDSLGLPDPKATV